MEKSSYSVSLPEALTSIQLAIKLNYFSCIIQRWSHIQMKPTYIFFHPYRIR